MHKMPLYRVIARHVDTNIRRVQAIARAASGTEETRRFQDEWVMCDSCFKYVGTTPQHAFWLPNFFPLPSSEVVCRDCFEGDDLPCEHSSKCMHYEKA